MRIVAARLWESGAAEKKYLISAGELGRRMLSSDGFGGSLLRQILFAVHQAAKNDETREGLNYLKTELPGYWNQRTKIVHILAYLAQLRNVAGMTHWRKDGEAAALLADAVEFFLV